MIDKKTSKSIIKAIGKNHLSKLVDFAKGRLENNYSSEASQKTIYGYVLHGKREDAAIEEMIIQCAEHYQKEKEAQLERLKNLAKRVKKTA